MRTAEATTPPEQPYCMTCGRLVRFNVPRLGAHGGFVHEDGSPDCNPADLASIERALLHTQPKPLQLTGNAAFMAAVAAGIPVASELRNGMLVMVLAQPVSVWIDGGVIKVFHRPDGESQKGNHA